MARRAGTSDGRIENYIAELEFCGAIKIVLFRDNQSFIQGILMGKQFSWKEFENVSKTLELLGTGVIILGLIVSVLMIIFGSSIIRIGGIVLIFVSLIVAVYHYSFSMLMNGIKEIMQRLEQTESSQVQSNP